MRRSILLRIVHQWPRQRPGLPHLPHALALQLARVAQWFHALSDTTRLDILELLSHKERCVCELEQVLGIAQSRLSFHLKVLKDAGLISDRKEGRWMFYGLERETLDQIAAYTKSVKPGKHAGSCAMACCD